MKEKLKKIVRNLFNLKPKDLIIEPFKVYFLMMIALFLGLGVEHEEIGLAADLSTHNIWIFGLVLLMAFIIASYMLLSVEGAYIIPAVFTTVGAIKLNSIMLLTGIGLLMLIMIIHIILLFRGYYQTRKIKETYRGI